MKERIAISLAFAALVVAVLGSTSVGQSASGAVKAGVNKARSTQLAGPLRVRAGQPVRRGPRGLRGKRGPRGPVGPPGQAGIAALTTALGPATSQCAYPGGACQVAASEAACPSGSFVVGGGFIANTPEDITVYAARVTTTSYGVIAVNWSSTPATIQAQAICASGAGIQATGIPDGSLEQMERTLQTMRQSASFGRR